MGDSLVAYMAGSPTSPHPLPSEGDIFTVVSKLKVISPPTNVKDILEFQWIKTLTLSDPHLRGAVDILIGNLDLDDCVFEGTLKVNRLNLLNTPFGWSFAGPLTGNPTVRTLTATAAADDL